jgi:hypothetical protein
VGGYLALLTPSPAPITARSRIAQIRYDTSRVRKLVATGDELQTLDDVEKALLPLLPLPVEAQLEAGAALLDRLPVLLAGRSVDSEATHVVVEAFLHNDSILERLHAMRASA